MNFHICHPGDALRPFVKQFYFWEDDSCGLIQLPQHLFTLGDQYMVFILEGEATIKPADHAAFTLPKHSVTGHFTCACELQVRGPLKMVVVQLNAYGCYRLLDMDVRSFTNYYRNLDMQESPVWTLLGTKLQQAKTPQEITSLLNDTYMEVLRCFSPALQQVDKMADYLLANQGNVSLHELAKVFRVSKPTLDRLFNRIVGIPPQLFARMVRFKAALRSLQQMDIPQWQISTTAHYNQAMFIQDHLLFNGEMPSGHNTAAQATITRMTAAEMLPVAVAS
ncbi:DUF6597 domain-containing transcriptional factor [Chitinophaga flava]|uniref:HTH araC/xylS-type domain-containing protein n=1 Tax=Chitinophaga flava TaxID=2259036 RepID=A0A365Y1I1_9BACT|nr:DUF6597 domain-containing transcriptional factor [Chitinophaga flava]RBL92091.1 hypothetical protein DF182_05720 [Chitinophaga flava]